MKTAAALLPLLLAVACTESDAKPKTAVQARSRVAELPSPGETFHALIKKELVKAKAAKLRPFLEFSAGWCKPCVVFKKSINDPRIQDAIEGTYIIIADFDEWSREAEALGVASIPAWLELDELGKPTGRRIDGGAWAEDTPENMAPPLKGFFSKNARDKI